MQGPTALRQVSPAPVAALASRHLAQCPGCSDRAAPSLRCPCPACTAPYRSVYEAPEMGMLDKRSVKMEDVQVGLPLRLPLAGGVLLPLRQWLVHMLPLRPLLVLPLPLLLCAARMLVLCAASVDACCSRRCSSSSSRCSAVPRGRTLTLQHQPLVAPD